MTSVTLLRSHSRIISQKRGCARWSLPSRTNLHRPPTLRRRDATASGTMYTRTPRVWRSLACHEVLFDAACLTVRRLRPCVVSLAYVFALHAQLCVCARSVGGGQFVAAVRRRSSLALALTPRCFSARGVPQPPLWSWVVGPPHRARCGRTLFSRHLMCGRGTVRRPRPRPLVAHGGC